MLDVIEVLALAAVLAVVTLVSLRLNRPEARAADRAREVVRQVGGAVAAPEDDAEPDLHRQARNLVTRLAERLPLFNPKQRRQLQNQLLTAGFRQPHALSVLVTLKLVAGTVFAILGAFANRLLPPDSGDAMPVILVLGGLQLGLMAPELALSRWVKRRQRAIYRAVPDALDLLVICTNAGYSLGASIKRIGFELREVSPALSNELEITAHEMQMNADPVEGLRHLAERTGVECLRSLVATLIQSHQYGTPITQSLKTLARSERNTRLLLLEEKGAKLATKITMPMMLLILPAVMLIAGGPAIMRLSEVFK
ncbi:MAG: type II secretion system F family protein [Magnetospirillum sp.]|nr:type II secretion system F family protein [Magnetospirillum sp.]